ncbi:UbiA prenyltransferase family [Trametes meyenii]|nr:UbiA prenyltransferase family [Trametes meyenii]
MSPLHFNASIIRVYRLDVITAACYVPVVGFLRILYSFTKSDILTILIPTSLFGTAASRNYGIWPVFARVLWVWLNLLQFCVSNQIHAPEEDKRNKPWRPIPTGSISVGAARYLRWTLLPICLIFSAHQGALAPAIALALATLAHNEFDLGSGWFARNALNAIGYGAFSIGATYVGCFDSACHSRASTALSAHAINAAVILTTIQAQDFKDVEGDTAIGRRTLPIVCPSGSRALTALLILMWSLVVAHNSGAHAMTSWAVVALGSWTGLRFFFGRARESDRRSYILYNVWLCLLIIAPFTSS